MLKRQPANTPIPAHNYCDCGKLAARLVRIDFGDPVWVCPECYFAIMHPAPHK